MTLWQRLLAQVKNFGNLRRAALEAEWKVPGGEIGNLIRQLRYRARRARFSSWVFLVVLIGVVVLGLGLYIGPPFLTQFYDGRRLTLNDSIALADTKSALLTASREVLRKDIAQALKWTIEPAFDGYPPPDVPMSAAQQINGSLVMAVGNDGGIYRYDPTLPDAAPMQVATFGNVGFQDFVKISDTLVLLLGIDNTTWRYDPTQRDKGPIKLPNVTGRGFWQAKKISDTLVLITVSNGILWRYDPTKPDEAPVQVPGVAGVGFYTALKFSDTLVLITGGKDTLWRYDPTKPDGTPVQVPAVAGDGVRFVFKISDTLVLITGGSGTLWRYDPTKPDGTPVQIPAVAGVGYSAAMKISDTLVLIRGDNNTLWRYDPSKPDGAPIQVPAVAGVSFDGFDKISDTLVLFYGDNNTLWRYDLTKPAAAPVQVPAILGVGFFGVKKISDTIVLIEGSNATLWRYDLIVPDAVLAPVPMPSGFSGFSYSGVIKVSDDLMLLVGKRGELFRYSTRIGKTFADLQPTKDPSADETALKKLIENLPPHLANSALFAPLRIRFAAMEAMKAGINGLHQAAQDGFLRLDGPNWMVIRDRQNAAFSEFMVACRNGVQPPLPVPPTLDGPMPEPLTLACIEGWKAGQVTLQQSWWNTLANQLPPGVLLLFLLATLGGLYRYNLRLAAFHHSRADALELLALGRDDGAVRDLVSWHDSDILGKIANALAADKVPFSNARTPVDQAVDLVKAVTQKS